MFTMNSVSPVCVAELRSTMKYARTGVLFYIAHSERTSLSYRKADCLSSLCEMIRMSAGGILLAVLVADDMHLASKEWV